jgi:hypothetical protein
MPFDRENEFMEAANAGAPVRPWRTTEPPKGGTPTASVASGALALQTGLGVLVVSLAGIEPLRGEGLE